MTWEVEKQKRKQKKETNFNNHLLALTFIV